MRISLMWASLLVGCAEPEVSFQIEGSRIVDVGTSEQDTNGWSFTFDVFEAFYDRMGVRSHALGTEGLWLEDEGPWDTDLTPDNGPFEIGVLPVDGQPYDRAMIEVTELLVEGKAEKDNDVYTFFFAIPFEEGFTTLCLQDFDLTNGGQHAVVSTWYGEQLFRTALAYDGGEINMDPWLATGASSNRRFTQDTLEAIDLATMESVGLDPGDEVVDTMWDWLLIQASRVPRIGDPCR